MGSAQENRGDEGSSFVELTGSLESSRESLAALQEEAGDVAAAQVSEGGFDAVSNKNLSSCLAKNRSVRFGRDHDKHRRLVEGSKQLRIERAGEPGCRRQLEPAADGPETSLYVRFEAHRRSGR